MKFYSNKLKEFADEMSKNHFCKNCVKKIDDEIFCCIDNYKTDKKEIHNATNYIQEKHQLIHSNIERVINKKVDVLSFMRDTREDWGDDGGYCMYVGKYKGRYILGSMMANYNLKFSDEYIDSNELLKEDENIEYKFFDSLEEINEYIDKILSLGKKYYNEYNERSIDPEYFKIEEDQFMSEIFKNFRYSFLEYYEKDIEKIKNLTNLNKEYVPNFFDPIVYYENWIEEQNKNGNDTFLCELI